VTVKRYFVLTKAARGFSLVLGLWASIRAVLNKGNLLTILKLHREPRLHVGRVYQQLRVHKGSRDQQLTNRDALSFSDATHRVTLIV
jgi:hypothetical protein